MSEWRWCSWDFPGWHAWLRWKPRSYHQRAGLAQAAAIRASQHYPVSAVFKQVLLSLGYLFVNILPPFFSAVMLSAGLAADYNQSRQHAVFLPCLPRTCHLFPVWAVVAISCADTFLSGYQTHLGQTEEHFLKGFANMQGVPGYRHWLPSRQPHTGFLHTKKHP